MIITTVVVVTVIALAWPREETFTGTVIMIKESRAALRIQADDHEAAACGVRHASMNGNIDSGVTHHSRPAPHDHPCR